MLKLLIGMALGWGAAWLWHEWGAYQAQRRAYQTLADVQAYLDRKGRP